MLHDDKERCRRYCKRDDRRNLLNKPYIVPCAGEYLRPKACKKNSSEKSDEKNNPYFKIQKYVFVIHMYAHSDDACHLLGKRVVKRSRATSVCAMPTIKIVVMYGMEKNQYPAALFSDIATSIQ